MKLLLLAKWTSIHSQPQTVRAIFIVILIEQVSHGRKFMGILKVIGYQIYNTIMPQRSHLKDSMTLPL